MGFGLGSGASENVGMASLRYRVLRVLYGHPRLVAGAIIGVAVNMLAGRVPIEGWLTRALIGWNAGVFTYLASTFWMMWRSDRDTAGRNVGVHDEGRWLVLGLSVLSVVASLFATVAELVSVRDAMAGMRNVHLACAVVTLGFSWIFIHVVFAVHYAREYDLDRSRGGSGGLVFPGDDAPGYFDFLYVSMVIGTSAQTADVGFSSKTMRRWGLVHCALSFFYNTTVVALTVNIGAGLF